MTISCHPSRAVGQAGQEQGLLRASKFLKAFSHLYLIRFYAAVFLLLFLTEAWCGLLSDAEAGRVMGGGRASSKSAASRLPRG